ncbi:hypothetical protein DY000_02016686 [Brassica cretica]|uniref:Uncharacterized protein n=1 Tax=Brassica cretica TaxID=69181 RepID=A0ABQ7CQ01_BRACR|nr:hypothetical protein DY000_02016686 [Brassica cretica]
MRNDLVFNGKKWAIPDTIDASWTSSEEKAGIGWALYNKDAKLIGYRTDWLTT